MLNYLNLKENNILKKDSDLNDIILMKKILILMIIDYYYSNAIARASKTMFNCRNEKIKFMSTGTES